MALARSTPKGQVDLERAVTLGFKSEQVWAGPRILRAKMLKLNPENAKGSVAGS